MVRPVAIFNISLPGVCSMRSVKRVLFPAIVAGLLAAQAFTANANESDRQYFSRIVGAWSGPGEIIAGKYKGTKFVCDFNGITPDKKVGLTLDGNCRVGLFNQKMSATVELAGNTYRGKFLDGAAGKGLDVISGNVVDQRKVVFGLNRKQLRGAMIASLRSKDSMVVTISVKVADKMVPVMGVNLKRLDQTEVGSIR